MFRGYNQQLSIVSNLMTRTTQQRDPKSLRQHRLAERLLARPDAGRLYPAPTEARAIEVLPTNVVVSGVWAYLAAVTAGLSQINVVVREDLGDEDAAAIASVVVTALLNGTRDVIAIGAAWAAFHEFCTTARPRSREDRTEYEKRFGTSSVKRLRDITVATFGCSDDQLRRYSKLVYLPIELQAAFRRGAVTLRALVELADQPLPTINAVAADVRSGMSPPDAIGTHMRPKEKRPAPRTALRQFLKAGGQAGSQLSDRAKELSYLTDEERDGLQATKTVIEKLLTIPSQDDVLSHIGCLIKAAKES